ncbi:MAG TPA: hypothetical protein VF618_09770 [Thermoanaerobaculia bacterium]
MDLTEDRVPLDGIEEAVEELVDLYGGDLKEQGAANERRFVLPLRRGVATSGGVECTLSWTAEGAVRMQCDRDVDAPRFQRVMLLVAGLVGAVLFMLWPFYPNQKEWGTLAWVGGAIALAVYFLTLRRTSGGIANEFLQRLARRQRAVSEEPEEAPEER